MPVVELRPGERNERIVGELNCFNALILRGGPAEDRGFFFLALVLGTCGRGRSEHTH